MIVGLGWDVRSTTGTDFDLDTSAIVARFGELYRNGAGWKFRAVGQGYPSGLAGIARDHGATV